MESIYRHLPLHAMVCAQDADHLAVVYCVQCRKRLCRACHQREHAGQAARPYRYVDWSVRVSENVTGRPSSADRGRRRGVILGDEESSGDCASDEPVHRAANAGALGA